MAALLSPRVWSHITSLLPRADIMTLSLVSRFFYRVIGEILARKVTLNFRSQGSHPTEMMHVLSRRYLLDKIKILTIVFTSDITALMIPLVAMGSLRQLRLSASKSIFPTVVSQNEFAWTLNQFCPYLELLDLYSEANLIGNELYICDLKRIKWSQSGDITPALFNLCAASFTTLSHLSIYVREDKWHDWVKYVNLLRLRFPALRSFSLGPSGGDNRPDYNMPLSVERELSSFLIAHPTLEHLGLESYHYGHIDWFLDFDSGMLDASVLPNIKSLNVHPNHMTTFAAMRASFLQNLHTLTIELNVCDGGDDDMSDGSISEDEDPSECHVHALKRMFVAIFKHTGPLNSLRKFTMNFTTLDGPNFSYTPATVINFVTSASALFPMLEKFTGTIFHKIVLLEHVTKFKHLIDVQVDGFEDDGDLCLADIATIAGICPSVRYVNNYTIIQETRDGCHTVNCYIDSSPYVQYYSSRYVSRA